MQKFSNLTQSFDGFTLDLTRGCLLRGSQEIKLPPKPFDALKYLVDNPGRLISKAELMTTLWPDTAVTDDSLVQCLMEVRRALGDETQQIIKTVPRRGYIFDREVRVNAASPPVTTYTEESGVQLIIEEEETNGPPVIETRGLPVAGGVALLPSQTELGFKRLRSWIYQHKLRVALSVVTLAVAAGAFVYFTRTGEAIDSVAVMPFVNVNGDPNTEYLSDGISDSIVHNLSRLPSLKKVISFNSVLRYKGKQSDPQVVGRELGVRAVLMGRVVQHGDDILISTELVDVRDNRRLWGGQYTRPMSDIIVVQDEIAREIAERLRLRLGEAGKQRLTKHHTENADAYHDYLKGRYLLAKRTPQTTEKSIEYFEQAIKLDPNYALAYATLANARLSLAKLQSRLPEEVLPQAKVAAAKALGIDDTLAEAHAALGSIRFYEWDWSGAEREFKRASELNPNYERNDSDYEHYLLAMKRFDEAVAESKRVLELEPVSVHHNRNVGMILYFARRYDEAIEQCHKTLELDPNMMTVYGWLAAAYEQKKLYDQSVAASLKGREVSGVSPEEVKLLRETYAKSGWEGYWRKVLDSSREKAKREYVNPHVFARIYTRLGEKDQAFTWLEKSYEQRLTTMKFLNTDPLWDDLRADPRYADLVRRMGLEP